MIIQLVESNSQILECYPVLAQLGRLVAKSDFVGQIQQQMKSGYQLVAVIDREQTIAVAGFHISTSLAWGKFLYVEDLVVEENSRSQNYGQILFQWLIDYAKEQIGRASCRERV